MKQFVPTGYSETVFKERYAFTEQETWKEACRRVAHQLAIAEIPSKQKNYEDKFYEVLVSNNFVPGGRIWYNSGRTNPQLLNCFVLRNNLDSKEGWGELAKEMIVTSMHGGGCGIDFSDVRPSGATINGQRGVAPGPVALMELIDGAAKPVKAGGSRRVALMFSLDLDHPDVFEFLDAKLTKGALTHANVSVRSKRTSDFISAVRKNGTWELSWKGQYKKTVQARELWDKIVKNAYNSAEPGFLNFELAEQDSTIAYVEPLVTTNPCFSPETLITTRQGLYPIRDLVGRTVEVYSRGKWVTVDNFRVTGTKQKILKVTLQDGSYVRCTPYHKFILEDGQRVEAKELVSGNRLAISEVETDGTHRERGAYLKGFLVGDGSASCGRPLLQLYPPKYGCEDRLLRSAHEMPNGPLRTNVVEDLCFTETSDSTRKLMQGLTPKKHELQPWCTEYKAQLPDSIFQWDRVSKLDFIAGVLDADGSALDSKNGYGYQLWSIQRGWLSQFQTLLKTVGVQSKLTLGKKAGEVNFNDTYGSYETKDCWRLTISQTAAIKLSKQVSFSRLRSFADKSTKYVIKSRFNSVVSIEEDGEEELVYCCTIEGSHSLTLPIGVEIGQCGEIFLSPHDCCCLGHLVLSRFVDNGEMQWSDLGNTIRTGVRMLDNTLSVNNYPLLEMKEKSQKLRRIGLGTTALADTLVLLGYRYGSKEGNKFIDKLYRFISKAAYEASVMLAVEKGPFPACDTKKHVETGFLKRMPAKIRALVAEHGIRNCALLTQAPTGTVSILSGNCSSGIEPMFAPAYERRYWSGTERKTETVIHPLFAEFMESGRDVSHFIASRDLSVEDHMEVQATIQRHVDNAVSKTINMASDYSVDDMSKLWLQYLPELKGTTFYRENSRGYVDEQGVIHEPPLTALSLEEAKKRYTDTASKEAAHTDDCGTGVCGI